MTLPEYVKRQIQILRYGKPSGDISANRKGGDPSRGAKVCTIANVTADKCATAFAAGSTANSPADIALSTALSSQSFAATATAREQSARAFAHTQAVREELLSELDSLRGLNLAERTRALCNA